MRAGSWLPQPSPGETRALLQSAWRSPKTRPSLRSNKEQVRLCCYSSDTAWESLSNKPQRGKRGHCGYSSANSWTLITLPCRLILNVRPRCWVKLRSLGKTVHFQASWCHQRILCLITSGVGRIREEGVSLTVAAPAMQTRQINGIWMHPRPSFSTRKTAGMTVMRFHTQPQGCARAETQPRMPGSKPKQMCVTWLRAPGK